MNITKTATIERYHVWGTSRHHLRITYRGHTLHWTSRAPSLAWVYADIEHTNSRDIQTMRDTAAHHGFTHCTFTGDWARWTKPRGGKLTDTRAMGAMSC